MWFLSIHPIENKKKSFLTLICNQISPNPSAPHEISTHQIWACFVFYCFWGIRVKKCTHRWDKKMEWTNYNNPLLSSSVNNATSSVRLTTGKGNKKNRGFNIFTTRNNFVEQFRSILELYHEMYTWYKNNLIQQSRLDLILVS